MNNLNNLYRQEDPVLSDALDRIVVKILQRKEQLGDQVFLTCGCEPKSGATTLAINIAIALAGSGWRVAVLDADMRKKPWYKRLAGQKGLVEYLNGSAELTAIVHTTSEKSLYYIPSGSSEENPVRLLCSSKLPELVSSLKSLYDFVLLDAPALGAAVDAEILAKRADAVILVARWSQTSKSRVLQSRNILERMGGKVAGIIINRMDMMQYRQYNENYSYFIDKKYGTSSPKLKTKGQIHDKRA